MKNLKLIGLLLMLGLYASCDSTVQYGVYVVNSTKEDLKLVFKSNNDVDNQEEQTRIIKPGDQKRILYTKNLTIEGATSTTSNHCSQVAEYIHAFKGDTPSKVKWCDKKIKFEKEDIGQATFTIEYTPADF